MVLPRSFSNTTGDYNTATGFAALYDNTTGNYNTANGLWRAQFQHHRRPEHGQWLWSLRYNTTGTYNTANGYGALHSNTTGGSNIALGDHAGDLVTTAHNVIAIGDAGGNVSNSCYIGSIFGQTSASGIPVLINSSNKLGTTTSSERFKEDIKPMDNDSEALLKLKPVTFRYKKEIDPDRQRPVRTRGRGRRKGESRSRGAR